MYEREDPKMQQENRTASPPLPPPTCFRIRNLTLNTVKIQEIVSIDFTGEGEEEGEGKGSGKNVAKR